MTTIDELEAELLISGISGAARLVVTRALEGAGRFELYELVGVVLMHEVSDTQSILYSRQRITDVILMEAGSMAHYLERMPDSSIIDTYASSQVLRNTSEFLVLRNASEFLSAVREAFAAHYATEEVS